MNLKQRRGFTLVEVLMVVAITGIIATAAIAPLVYAVIRVVDAEERYNDEEALQRGLSLIIKDIFETMRTAKEPLIRTLKQGMLGGTDDYSIIAASTSPARQNLPAGSVVYRIIRKTVISRNLPEGLYRWVVPLLLPSEIDIEELDEEDAQLVLTDVTDMKVEILIPPDWSEDEYSGGLPAGIKISLARGEKRVERVEWLQK